MFNITLKLEYLLYYDYMFTIQGEKEVFQRRIFSFLETLNYIYSYLNYFIYSSYLD